MQRVALHHGEVFVGAVRTEPSPMRNVDFTENQLEPDAPWLLSAPAENAAYSVEMRGFLAAVRGKSVSAEQKRDLIASRDAEEEEEEEEEVEHGLLSTVGLAEYFAALTAERPVEIRALAGRGNGLVSSRAIKQGEALWSEPPVVSMQEPENVRTTMACAWCHRSVGDIDTQLSLAAGLCTPEEAVNACIPPPIDEGNEGNGGNDGERVGTRREQREQRKQREIAGSSSGGGGRGGWADIARLSLPAMEDAEGIVRVVPCKRRRSRRCQAKYCSVECRFAHGGNGHAICCGGGG
jgi:hypothetical protein